MVEPHRERRATLACAGSIARASAPISTGVRFIVHSIRTKKG